jgi:DNA polymerase-1
MESEKTVYLIDGTACIHRAYHAIRSLSNSAGLPTNATFGFTRILLKLMQERVPQYAAMFFDAKGPTFRHEIYPDYKANRPPMPEDMAVQIPYIKEVTAAYRLPIIEMQGFEADDLIGTYARRAEKEGFAVVMVTGDKDFMQLVTDNIVIWDPMKEQTLDIQFIREKFGVEPQQMIDVMGLSGDSADNVPGVPGIGQKTALDLVKLHGNMDQLYQAVDSITKKKQRENLTTYKDQAFLSRKLVTIDTRVPVDISIDDFDLKPPDTAALSKLFQSLEFRQLQQSVSAKSDLRDKQYKAITDQGALSELIARLETADLFALDTETTSTNPMLARLVGLSFAIQPHEAFYIPCGHHYLGPAGIIIWECPNN